MNKEPKNLEINVSEKITVTASIKCHVAITTISRELIREAKKYLEENKTCKIGFAVPIILSHMALEMQVSSMEKFFLKRERFNNEEIDAILRQNINIANRKRNELSKTRLLFKLILKENIPEGVALDELNKANSLRNQVIHGGKHVSREDAEEAMNNVERAVILLEEMFTKLANPKKTNQ